MRRGPQIAGLYFLGLAEGRYFFSVALEVAAGLDSDLAGAGVSEAAWTDFGAAVLSDLSPEEDEGAPGFLPA